MKCATAIIPRLFCTMNVISKFSMGGPTGTAGTTITARTASICGANGTNGAF